MIKVELNELAIFILRLLSVSSFPTANLSPNWLLINISEAVLKFSSSSADFENGATTFDVFPNPFKDVLFVRNNGNSKDDFQLQLFDSEGKLAASKTIDNTNLNTQTLPKGIYFYQINNSKGQTFKTGKLVK